MGRLTSGIVSFRMPEPDEQTGAPAFGYPAKDQRELAAECAG